MENGIVKRNYKGAGLGGMLGILAGWFIHPAILPFGVIGGVIVGFYHGELWNGAKEAFRSKLAEMRKARRRRALARREAWRNFRTASGEAWTEVRDELILPVLTPFGQLACWVMGRPAAVAGWVKTHPTNTAYLLRIAGTIAGAALSALPYLFLATKLHAHALPKTTHGDSYALASIIIGCLALMFAVLPFPMLDGIETDSLTGHPSAKVYYGHWERYARLGAVRYFAAEAWKTLVLEMRLLGLAVWTLLWFLGIGGLYSVLVLAPVAALVGLAKAAQRAVEEDGRHWPCLGVTLAATLLTLWTGRPYIHHPAAVWTLALFTGLASGLATEAARRALKDVFARNNDAYSLARIGLGIWIDPVFQPFARTTDAMLERVRL